MWPGVLLLWNTGHRRHGIEPFPRHPSLEYRIASLSLSLSLFLSPIKKFLQQKTPISTPIPYPRSIKRGKYAGKEV